MISNILHCCFPRIGNCSKDVSSGNAATPVAVKTRKAAMDAMEVLALWNSSTLRRSLSLYIAVYNSQNNHLIKIPSNRSLISYILSMNYSKVKVRLHPIIKMKTNLQTIYLLTLDSTKEDIARVHGLTTRYESKLHSWTYEDPYDCMSVLNLKTAAEDMDVAGWWVQCFRLPT